MLGLGFLRLKFGTFLWATLIVGKNGRREIRKYFPTKYSSLRLVSTLNAGKYGRHGEDFRYVQVQH